MKSKILSIITVLLFSIICIWQSNFAQDVMNYVKNSGFETGTLDEWIYSNNAFVEESNQRNGNYCVALEAGKEASITQKVKGLQSNTTYIFYGFGKTAIDDDKIFLGVRNFGAQEISYFVDYHHYLPVAFKFTLGDTNTSVEIFFSKAADTDSAFADNFGIIADTNYVINPGFETGNFNGWDKWKSNSKIVNNNQRTGDFCARIGNEEGGFSQKIINLVPKTEYILTAYAKMEALGGVCWYGVADFGFDYQVATSVDTNVYTLRSMDFMMGNSATTAGIWVWKNDDARPRAFMDDFLVFKPAPYDTIYIPEITQLLISPDSVSLFPGDSIQFSAEQVDDYNIKYAFTPIWEATGGTINRDGLYIAGDIPGDYMVTATDTANQLTDQVKVSVRQTTALHYEELQPMQFCLYQNFPNPFNPETTICFDVRERSHVVLKIHDILGREVRVLADTGYDQGRHSVILNASSLPTGLYFYSIEMGNYRSIKKMLLMK